MRLIFFEKSEKWEFLRARVNNPAFNFERNGQK